MTLRDRYSPDRGCAEPERREAAEAAPRLGANPGQLKTDRIHGQLPPDRRRTRRLAGRCSRPAALNSVTQVISVVARLQANFWAVGRGHRGGSCAERDRPARQAPDVSGSGPRSPAGAAGGRHHVPSPCGLIEQGPDLGQGSATMRVGGFRDRSRRRRCRAEPWSFWSVSPRCRSRSVRCYPAQSRMTWTLAPRRRATLSASGSRPFTDA